jgi:O-acetyl-ADP-ribose deacetylase
MAPTAHPPDARRRLKPSKAFPGMSGMRRRMELSPRERLQVVQGDIAQQRVDAVVNAANEQLAPGSGVSGALHAAAGPELAEECRKLGGCATGDAKVTPGFGLPARWVIHAVGPVWQGGQQGEADQLAAAYRASFKAARDKGARTVAFPALSAGTFGFPLDQAVRVGVAEALDALARHAVPERVVFVAFDAPAHAAFKRAVAEVTARSR